MAGAGDIPWTVLQPAIARRLSEHVRGQGILGAREGPLDHGAGVPQGRRIRLHRVQTTKEGLGLHHAVPRSVLQEEEILLSSGDRLGHDQVVGLEAQAFDSTRVLVPDDDEALPPAMLKASRFLTHSVGVVAEGLVERRELADGAVNDIRALRMVQREKIRFHRDAHGRRGVGELSEDRLAADDDDLIVIGDIRGGADEVLELLAGHGRWEKRSRVSRQILQRSWGCRAPANGLDWRSSSASSLRSTRKAAIEEMSPARISAHFRA